MQQETKIMQREDQRPLPKPTELLGRVLEHLNSESYRALIAAATDIEEKERGCTTPTEEFLSGLMAHYWTQNCRLTPNDVECDLEHFKTSFEAMCDDVRQFAETYPEAFDQLVEREAA
jgi:CO dehydrogenase nickel-insertion accessory protein CooC1